MNYDEYRKEKVIASEEFEDFICNRLCKEGWFFGNYKSKKYQLTGENTLGLEIKYDMVFKKTGRLYIETHEKAKPRPGEYALSGIYRNDNTCMYGIGDYDVFYVFAKSLLVMLDNANPEWLMRPNPTPTSKGFCIPVDQAKRLCIKEFVFENLV